MRGHGGHGLAKSGMEAELLLSRCSVRTHRVGRDSAETGSVEGPALGAVPVSQGRGPYLFGGIRDGELEPTECGQSRSGAYTLCPADDCPQPVPV